MLLLLLVSPPSQTSENKSKILTLLERERFLLCQREREILTLLERERDSVPCFLVVTRGKNISSKEEGSITLSSMFEP